MFLLLLCLTGVVLNHTQALGLDTRFVGQSWLLDWYGIGGPPPGPSFAAGERWLTLAGDRLYLDAAAVNAPGLGPIVGAAGLGSEIVVAAPAELLLLNADGDVVERSPVAQSLPAPVDAIAPASGAILLLSGGMSFRYDPADGSVTAAARESDPVWAEPRPLPEGIRAGIETDFRGRGLSLERVLMDLHSGRLLGLSGALFNDLVAIALSLLAITGVWLFFRR